MLLPGCHILRTCFFITVFLTTIFADPAPSPEGDKTFNLKIGFDLTHGKNGAPALRIRDFEDSSEYRPRASEDVHGKNNKESGKDDDEKKVKDKGPLRNKDSSSSESGAENEHNVPTNKRASSSSSESEEKGKPKADGAGAVDKGSDKSDDASGVSVEHDKRSTRGIENFEPEEQNPSIHGRGDDDDRRRRRKRSPEERLRNRREAEKFIEYYFEKMKLKHKKVNKLPDELRITSYKPF